MDAVGRDNVYFEVQKNKIALQDKCNEGIVKIAREVGRPRRRHRRRPLPDPRGLPPPRGAAVRADQVDARRAEDHLRHQRVLPALDRGDGQAEFAEWPEAIPTTLEVAERCNVEIELGGQLLPAYQCPDGKDEAPTCASSSKKGLTPRFGDPIPGRRPRARRLRALGHRPDGLQRLLPHRLGLRQLRQGRRHRRRARAVVRPPARSSPTASPSPTSTRCVTTCCSSASSTPSACRCPISTWTSRCAAASA